MNHSSSNPRNDRRPKILAPTPSTIFVRRSKSTSAPQLMDLTTKLNSPLPALFTAFFALSACANHSPQPISNLTSPIPQTPAPLTSVISPYPSDNASYGQPVNIYTFESPDPLAGPVLYHGSGIEIRVSPALPCIGETVTIYGRTYSSVSHISFELVLYPAINTHITALRAEEQFAAEGEYAQLFRQNLGSTITNEIGEFRHQFTLGDISLPTSWGKPRFFEGAEYALIASGATFGIHECRWRNNTP